MPRIAIPLRTPGGGDCFFHAVAASLGKLVNNETHARDVRRDVATYLASRLFAGPNDDLATLTTAVTTAPGLAGVGGIAPQAGGEADAIRKLWRSQMKNAVPANGNGVPLAAWVVWLQYSASEIAAGRANRPGCAALLANRFLDYVLWGDTDVSGHAVQNHYGRPVVVYRDGDNRENVEHDPAVSIYHTPNPAHFSGVRFVDPAEDDVWDESLYPTLYGEDADPVARAKECPLQKGRKKTPTLIVVDPKAVLAHARAPKSISTQYSPPPMSIPRGTLALRLLDYMLTETRRVMGASARCTAVVPIDFTKFKNPPVYVISSNRASWLAQVFWSGELFVGGLVKGGAGRAVIFVVDAGEALRYAKELSIKEAAKQGVYLLAVRGGFGMSMSRHCALRHAAANGFGKAWVFDDNVANLGKGTIADVDDDLLEDVPAVSYSSRTPLILERVVGFNLQWMRKLDANFCPFFAYNKDDKSLEEVLKQKGFDYGITPHPTLGIERPGVVKVDKGTFQADSDIDKNAMKHRIAVEDEIALMPVWETAEAEQVEVMKLVNGHAGRRDLMKWQEHVMWAILRNPVAAQAFAKWFSDAALDLEFA
ncbi:hypothetical protein [Longimicrobium sp.]|uniref:hypothetical protein n=1 Tax=Longimicrobium sp. TaxID=2029185 RepID=UPI002CE21DEA|nr:hypothetical protein [Longimicrobium sp.]HSU13848.1 hypothetical protein [Longimicrobium sp.]